jgi:predicted SnoaL-like aldol condensation-catalyzing enzyme
MGYQKLNKKTVIDFYETVINRKDWQSAPKFVGKYYKQHNQHAKDGVEGLQEYVKFTKEKYPNSHSEIKKAFACGDYVILHVYSIMEPGTCGAAVIDIFRMENGKAVEHWDVHEEIVEKPANGNTMF